MRRFVHHPDDLRICVGVPGDLRTHLVAVHHHDASFIGAMTDDEAEAYHESEHVNLTTTDQEGTVSV